MLPHFLLIFPAVCGVSPYVPHRYHFVNQSKTWTEAQSYCRQTYTDLATINNMDEMKKVNKTRIDNGGHFVWIGLNRGDTGRWQWSLGGGNFDGDSYRNWSSGEPSNHGGIEFCVSQWHDVNCNIGFPFICYESKLCLTYLIF
uniref:C-type lectin domain-containing protein n=1 Tax=Astyanax mexicanus TaxID=7994 RepID=A0A8B9H964_ASTMX